MSEHACACATSGPPMALDGHRRIRLRRLGLQGAVARAVADLAFGEPRDTIVLVAVTGASPLAEGERS